MFSSQYVYTTNYEDPKELSNWPFMIYWFNFLSSAWIQIHVLNFKWFYFTQHFAKEKTRLIIENHVTALLELPYFIPPSSLLLQLSVLSL